MGDRVKGPCLVTLKMCFLIFKICESLCHFTVFIFFGTKVVTILLRSPFCN